METYTESQNSQTGYFLYGKQAFSRVKVTRKQAVMGPFPPLPFFMEFRVSPQQAAKVSCQEE